MAAFNQSSFRDLSSPELLRPDPTDNGLRLEAIRLEAILLLATRLLLPPFETHFALPSKLAFAQTRLSIRLFDFTKDFRGISLAASLILETAGTICNARRLTFLNASTSRSIICTIR